MKRWSSTAVRRLGRRNKWPGFTLIELLVVVSIIALLIAILLPSLKHARDQAKAVVCKANMRSIGQAFTMYAEKFGGVWPPPVDTFGNQNRWPVPFHQGGIIDAQFGRYGTSGQPVRRGDNSIFLCPAEPAPRAIPNWRNIATLWVDRVEVGGSYAMTEEGQRRGGVLDRGSFPPNAVPPFCNKVENCRRASSVYAVLENFRPLEKTDTPGWRFNRGAKQLAGGGFEVEGGGFYTGYRMYDGTPVSGKQYEAYRIIGGRHANSGNGLCIDTHVESYRPNDVKYDEVSWVPWADRTKAPPGGI